MNSSQINLFSNVLQQSCSQSTYLSKGGLSPFVLVDKRDKNLNTEEISLIAEQYFIQLTKDKTLSLGKRIELEASLANSLKVYSARVYQSKPWYLKIAAFFCCNSEAEKRINRVAKDLFTKVKNEQKVDGDINKSKIVDITKLNFPLPYFDLKLFYHKTAENSEHIEQLDGLPFYVSFNSIIEDLRDFNEQFSDKIIGQLIIELEFALAVSRLQNKYDLNILSCKIFEKVQQLPIPNDTEKSFMVLPGGFKRHATLYVIERHADGKYSFRVVNTGSGLSYLFSRQAIDEEGILHMPTDLAKDDQLLAACYGYSDLAEDHLNPSFFEKILSMSISSPDMKEVGAFMNSNLLTGSNLVLHSAHSKQKHGTCSVRCILEFLKIELDIVPSGKFHKFMLDKEIKKFESYFVLRMASKIFPKLAALKRNAEIERDK